MKTKEQILTKERLEYVTQRRNAVREAAFNKAGETIGPEALEELRKLYKTFDEKIYIWIANLWDRTAGAFYYSQSARDTVLYGPDVESTKQALRFLDTSGMVRAGEGSYFKRIPGFLRDSVVRFTYHLQDSDGYFYHPQWGKNIFVSRRGRDLGSAKYILALADAKPKYLLPTQKDANGKKSAMLPDYLQSIESFAKYLDQLELSSNSYFVGNIIESTMAQISAAGKEYEAHLLQWLNSQNRVDNGLWEAGLSYASVNGLMKISGSYPHLRVPLPHAKASLASAIAGALSDERMKFVCEVYNPWAAIGNIFRANENAADKTELNELQAYLLENAAALIRKTREKIAVFRKEDGSYSYFKRMSCAVSQRAPAAVPRTNEGDMNATTICVGSTVKSMREALNIPEIPIFAPEDGDLFFELLACAPAIEKKYYIGDVFPEKPSYEEETAE